MSSIQHAPLVGEINEYKVMLRLSMFKGLLDCIIRVPELVPIA